MSNAISEKIRNAWISGMPRSGTTWLSQIFASSPKVRLKTCPLFSYEFKNSLNESSTADDWAKLFSDVYKKNSEYLDQNHLRKHGLVPTFDNKIENPQNLIIKSVRFHNLIPYILKLNQEIRFVHIVRHPCATVHSWLTDPNQFPRHADPIVEWKNGSCRKTGPGEFWGFNDWKLITTQALRLREVYPSRFKIVRYEDLVHEALICAMELFSYLDIDFENQTREFIVLSQSRHDGRKHSVFKKTDLKDKWKGALSPAIVSECLNDVRGTELEQFTIS